MDGRESRVLAWEAKEKKAKASAKGVEEKKPVDLEKEWARTAAAKQVRFWTHFITRHVSFLPSFFLFFPVMWPSSGLCRGPCRLGAEVARRKSPPWRDQRRHQQRRKRPRRLLFSLRRRGARRGRNRWIMSRLRAPGGRRSQSRLVSVLSFPC